MRTLVAVTIALAPTVLACGGDPAGAGLDASMDDASSTEDGGVDDAMIDAPPIDLPVTCGTETCRVGETCESGTCVASACVGANVPGDHATIQAAATALAAAGNDATICLGNRMYPAPASGNAIFLDDAGNHGKTLRIVGQGMDRSRLAGRFFVGGGWAKVTFENVEITAPSSAAIETTESVNPNVEVVASRLRGPTGIEASERTELRVAGTVFDVSNTGISLFTSTTGPMTVRVENSLFVADGVAISANNATASTLSLTVASSTIRGVDYGIQLSPAGLSGNVTAVISSSIFTDVAQHAIAWRANDTVTGTNNALWGNGNNYSGIASDGVDYVKQDCLLTSTSPAPNLGAGSPCRDAGDPVRATTHDFYGVARGTPPDIGAVEAL